MTIHNELVNKISKNIKKVIIGKDEVIELVLTALLAKGHILIEDVPGIGKTSLVTALAKSLSMSFNRIQFTPDILPSDISGFSMYDFNSGTFKFHEGMIMKNIVLADELNRTSPRTQSSLLEAMEGNHVSVDGITYNLPKPFMVLATQNPIENVGTYPLPEAQLDRFLFKVSLGYPSKSEEVDILERFQGEDPLVTLEAVATVKDIINLQEKVKNIKVSTPIKKYISEIVSATRTDEDIVLGASPRGSIALMKAAQAYAFINNRSYVLPEDIKYIVAPVLSHRILLKPETRLKNISSYDVLKRIINNIYPPVIENEQEEYA